MTQINTNADVRIDFRTNLTINNNDNSITIRGTGPNGVEDKSFLLNDPDLEEKVKSMIERLETFQINKIKDAHNESLEQFNNKLNALKDQTFDFVSQFK